MNDLPETIINPRELFADCPSNPFLGKLFAGSPCVGKIEIGLPKVVHLHAIRIEGQVDDPVDWSKTDLTIDPIIIDGQRYYIDAEKIEVVMPDDTYWYSDNGGDSFRHFDYSHVGEDND